MRTSTIVAEYRSSVARVWNIVTDNRNIRWRSDLRRVEILEDAETFIEYTHQGHQTRFTITGKELYSRYSFDMANKMFIGYWTGAFSATPAGGTRIEFSETLYFKNPFYELLSYIGLPLKKIQRRYAEDLREALGETEE